MKKYPEKLVSFEEAKSIHKKLVKEKPDYFVNAYVHFYIDDQKFDGKQSSIWLYPQKALEILCHFAGAISPDFSTFSDFPDALKRYNTYCMRAFGYWLTTQNICVINNVRWNTAESWRYCFDGIPYGSVVAIGTVASGIHKLENRPEFESGLFKMVDVICPSAIIVYGSSKYSFFDALRDRGIEIISFPSSTSLAFKEVRPK